MFVARAAGVVLGWAWNYSLPINKALWTSSYVLFAAGMALQLLAVCYWLLDVKNLRRWALPFVVFGTNALAAFFLSGVVARVLGLVKVGGPGGKPVSVQRAVYESLFASWAAPLNASLAYAVCFVLLMLGLMAILYRKRIFIKV